MSASRNLQKVLGNTSKVYKQPTQGTRGLKELAALAAHSKCHPHTIMHDLDSIGGLGNAHLH